MDTVGYGSAEGKFKEEERRAWDFTVEQVEDAEGLK